MSRLPPFDRREKVRVEAQPVYLHAHVDIVLSDGGSSPIGDRRRLGLTRRTLNDALDARLDVMPYI
jgi:hypothetical protein